MDFLKKYDSKVIGIEDITLPFYLDQVYIKYKRDKINKSY